MHVSSAPLARALLGLGLFVALAADAQTQLPMMHGMTKPPAALEARVAEADVAAIATVDAVEGGRIQLGNGIAVLGEVPARFDVKRKPSAPLPLAKGDRVLLLLRGARSPYLVVDVPADTVRIPDDAAALRWTDAIRAVAERSNDPTRLRELYVSWSEGDSDDLRAEAMRSLLQLGGPFVPLPPPLSMERARVALDPARTPAVRNAAATLAASDATALDWMLSRVAGRSATADPALTATILRAGLTRTRPGARTAMLAVLRSDDPELRLAALSLAQLAPREAVEGELTALAAHDPDPRVREQAAHWLARTQKKDAGAG